MFSEIVEKFYGFNWNDFDEILTRDTVQKFLFINHENTRSIYENIGLGRNAFNADMLEPYRTLMLEMQYVELELVVFVENDRQTYNFRPLEDTDVFKQGLFSGIKELCSAVVDFKNEIERDGIIPERIEEVIQYLIKLTHINVFHRLSLIAFLMAVKYLYENTQV